MISTLDMFTIGIGPSSSHTVGPMRAAGRFVRQLSAQDRLRDVERVTVDLRGSLGATGPGHGTAMAVLLGLQGEDPKYVSPVAVENAARHMPTSEAKIFVGDHELSVIPARDILHRGKEYAFDHPNTIIFEALDYAGKIIFSATYHSVGGGFVVDVNGVDIDGAEVSEESPFEFHTGAQLLDLCDKTGMSISEIILKNEIALHGRTVLNTGLLEVWEVMKDCVERGCVSNYDKLPGGLGVNRRAPALYSQLSNSESRDSVHSAEWVGLYALAVNEENAAGGRVVTAPTNGAAGIIPAVLHYYMKFVPGANQDGVMRFLLVASAIGNLIKRSASISGAEVGCQGEIGSACAMAAGALCEVLGGSPMQVENAAEIGLEHNLGLTCDPVAGLVQIPCIERNAIASNKAINAARLALRGNGNHHVSLDCVIKTMKETGADMHAKYKETSRGGLAVNVVEC